MLFNQKVIVSSIIHFIWYVFASLLQIYFHDQYKLNWIEKGLITYRFAGKDWCEKRICELKNILLSLNERPGSFHSNDREPSLKNENNRTNEEWRREKNEWSHTRSRRNIRVKKEEKWIWIFRPWCFVVVWLLLFDSFSWIQIWSLQKSLRKLLFCLIESSLWLKQLL